MDFKPTNFDIRIKRSTVLLLLIHEIDRRNNFDIMCKELHGRSEWNPITFKDLNDDFNQVYQTFEIWLGNQEDKDYIKHIVKSKKYSL